jgi:hypothetical protein
MAQYQRQRNFLNLDMKKVREKFPAKIRGLANFFVLTFIGNSRKESTHGNCKAQEIRAGPGNKACAHQPGRLGPNKDEGVRSLLGTGIRCGQTLFCLSVVQQRGGRATPSLKISLHQIQENPAVWYWPLSVVTVQ